MRLDGRGAAGSYPPGAPTDPDVRNSRNRLLGSASNGSVPSPYHTRPVGPPTQPLVPTAFHRPVTLVTTPLTGPVNGTRQARLCRFTLDDLTSLPGTPPVVSEPQQVKAPATR